MIKRVTAFMKKDILFNAKWGIVFIICSFLFPLYFITQEIDLHIELSVLFAFGTLTTTVVYVSRICYLEDSVETKQFIRGLPVSYGIQIVSRYILVILLIIVSNLIGIFVYISYGYHEIFRIVPVSVAFSLLLCSIFLGAFYFFGYQIAEYTFLFVALLFALTQRGNGLLQIENIIEYRYLIITICIIIYFVSCALSIKEVLHQVVQHLLQNCKIAETMKGKEP